jgi:hypothetical protein
LEVVDMADATPAMGNHRNRALSPKVAVELFPVDLPDYWHIAIFRAGLLQCSKMPKPSKLLPQLLNAVGCSNHWQRIWHWPGAETNPYREIQQLGFVYYIEAEGLNLVKIGYSTDPLGRIGALQEQSPVAMRLLGTCIGDRKLEHQLHRRFADYRQRGEWFRMEPEVMAFMQTQAQDARWLYCRYALPWKPQHIRASTAQDAMDRQAEYADDPSLRSGSVMHINRSGQEVLRR